MESKKGAEDGGTGLGKPKIDAAKSLYASIEDGQEEEKDTGREAFREMQRKINAVDTGSAATKAYGLTKAAEDGGSSPAVIGSARSRKSHSHDYATPIKTTD